MSDFFEGEIPPGYITGLGRDVPTPRLAHLYKGDFDEPGMGMCRFAYNRPGGYSIWRGNVGEGGDTGVCKICTRRAQEGRDPIPWPTESTEVTP